MIEDTEIIRRIDLLGRIVIPINIREELEIKENTPMKLLIDRENKRIILEEYKITKDEQ